MSRRLGSLLAVLVTGGLAACSGATDSDLFTAPESGGIRTVPTPDSGTAPDPSSPATSDAGPPVTPADAGPRDAGPPVAVCTAEAEPNDELEDATPFTTDFCGQVSGQEDLDFGRFVVPAGARNMTITHTEAGGKVAYRYYKNGTLLPVTAELPATPGTVYTVLVRRAAGSKATDKPTYELHVAFE